MQKTASVVEKACLERRCIATEVIVACVFVAAGMCLPSSCMAMDFSSDFTIPAFGHHVTVLRAIKFVDGYGKVQI
jgi:hypothetical protein